jgi:UDP-glucuronate 4-epimerase
MKVLVTGGAGFIGSHVAETLVRRGDDVIVVDDLNDFYSPALKQANLKAIGAAGPFLFRRADIRDQAEMERIFTGHRPDTVIHLAARAGVRPSLEQPLLYEDTNVRGTMVLLEAARRFGAAKFVFASSSSIYGLANSVPFSEDDHRHAPISPYAATKIAGEMLCHTWAHLYGLKTVCLRFFTVYGPRQRPDLAIHKFTGMIDRGEAIPVFGDGSSARDYTFVDDIVPGILAAADYDCRFDVFNLGNSDPVSLLSMIGAIERALGKEARREMLPEQAGDVPITYARISKSRRLLGYNPRTGFREGIERFVAWYRDQKAARPATGRSRAAGARARGAA